MCLSTHCAFRETFNTHSPDTYLSLSIVDILFAASLPMESKTVKYSPGV